MKSEQQLTIAGALNTQAVHCAKLGSPFSSRVLELMAANVEAGGAFLPLFDPWRDASADQLASDAVALRVLGGLHELVLDGADVELASHYPPKAADSTPERLRQVLDHAAAKHCARLAALMTSRPQTNEVRRSACLLGGFLTIAQETGLPLRCLEIGASAGLNLNWDRFRYQLGDAGTWGDLDAALALDVTWRGLAPPLEVRIHLTERAGCDQAPIDPCDDAQARRLQAYVWADQIARLSALRGALTVARTSRNRVEKADAADWAARRLTLPVEGVTTVLYHSIVWPYLPARTRSALLAALEEAGMKASIVAPLAWLRMEPAPEHRFEVRLTTWPGGRERLLAEVHPHGTEITWCAAPGR